MIPIYINVFNRLTTTRNLVDQIKLLTNVSPIIIDNDSDYEPLLDWYSTNPCEIIRLRENIGHHAPWLSGVISGDKANLYVVTDCDLNLDGVPNDVLTILQLPFNWSNKTPIKSGLALRIDDLPEWQSSVITWESRFWKKPVVHDKRFYWAAIDTTFAMYRGSTPHKMCMNALGTLSVRLGGAYQARHTPWYLNCENMDSENTNYFKTANSSNSWKPDGKILTANYLDNKNYAPRSL